MIEKENALEKHTILQPAIAVRYVCPLCGWQENRRKQARVQQRPYPLQPQEKTDRENDP